jgi:two-component system response regulator FixJ
MQDPRRRVVAVVDDDEAVRESFRFLLEIAGYDVATFASAGAFLQQDAPERPDCLLVDQHMPHITGLELLQRLQVQGQQVPVALMTGSPSAELARRAVDLGVAGLFVKPLTEEVLFGFVERAVSGKFLPLATS